MIEERQNRETHPCDRPDCIRYGLWISKIPERGLVYTQAAKGVQKETCLYCEHWKGLNHLISTINTAEEPPKVQPVKKKSGRPKKKPDRE